MTQELTRISMPIIHELTRDSELVVTHESDVRALTHDLIQSYNLFMTPCLTQASQLITSEFKAPEL